LTRIAFETILQLAAAAARITERLTPAADARHPFEQRGFAGTFPGKVRQLFDDGHYAEAVLTAHKFLDKYIQRHSGASQIGKSLMMEVFKETAPTLRLGDLATETGRNQQEGFKFLCAGTVLFARNPRAHEVEMPDSPDDCLNYLGIVATLIREMIKVGYK
jgi:uncharacterized protein (TIGR02391 family)